MRTSFLVTLVAASVLGGTAWATPLPTPAGLTAGDTFRFLFLTTGSTAAVSGNIADYDAFVSNQAGAATYRGSPISWFAVGSTAALAARDHVGGFSTNVPVYLVTGTKVAGNLGTGAEGLWSGSLMAGVNYGIDGLEIVSSPPFTWTGSNPDGTVAFAEGLGTQGLGSSLGVAFGFIGATDGSWMFTDAAGSIEERPMIGISETLQVVPEPSTVALAACGVGILSLRLRRKRCHQGGEPSLTG